MNALLDRLRSEFNGYRTQIETTQQSAADRGEDLSDAEQANVDELLERAERLRPRIEHLVAQEQSFSATADALSRVTQGGGAQIERSGDMPNGRAVEIVRGLYPTPGHYMLDMLLTAEGPEARHLIGSAGMTAKRSEAQARLARATDVMRAVANVLTTDVAGLLPVSVVGDVIAIQDSTRPVWSSFTSRPMPGSGKTFQRPQITQFTDVAKQATEKTEITSRKMTVGSITLTKDTYGGYVDISVQAVDWTDPAILTLVLTDLADQYAIETEAAASALLAAITQTSVLVAAPTAAQVAAFIADASAKVYAGSKRLPDRIWASVDMWAKLLGLTATDGRPAFPGVGATNTAGNISDAGAFVGNIMGLPLVVGPALPASTLIVGTSRYAESYEDVRGQVRQFEVALLGWLVGYYGYAVAAILVPNAFCKNSLT